MVELVLTGCQHIIETWSMLQTCQNLHRQALPSIVQYAIYNMPLDQPVSVGAEGGQLGCGGMPYNSVHVAKENIEGHQELLQHMLFLT